MITALRSPLLAAPLRRAATAAPAAPEPEGPRESYTPSQVIEQKDFRSALGRFPTGAALITTGQGAERRGMTASSFHSVSLDPPLVSFCAANGSGTLTALQENGSFAVNVLADDQQGPCFRFADKRVEDRFAGQDFTPGPATGAPLLEGATARFECKVWQVVPAGDHQIVLGEVVGMDTSDKSPLVFYAGQPRQLGP